MLTLRQKEKRDQIQACQSAASNASLPEKESNTFK